MRNLQKILALALALIMSFSLVVTANAAFSDEADITDTYNESVNVLSQLEVFKGYTDGTYQPQKSITRAEVAAIIYRIATGDVTDTQVSIYSDWNRFSDVHTGEWWAGYINYCANAEYIKGYGNGKFGPDDPVTGYEALAMILRAVGYGKMEGEFQGSDWAVQTAARANTLKVTKNVQNSALLNSAATRELVAELLFRSILVPTVEYNQFSGYTENDTTLAYQSFGLEAIQGVVVANEYANLYDIQILDADKTDLQEADGTIRHLDITSELTSVGESHYAYIIDATRGAKVLGLEKSENNTWEPENGKGTSIKDALKAADMRQNDDTEFYLNFGRDGHFYCDQRLEFTVIFDNKTAEDSFNTYHNISEYAFDRNVNGGAADKWTVEYTKWTEKEDGTYASELKSASVTANANADNSDYSFAYDANNPAASDYPVRYNRVIRANEEITSEEMEIIEGIFAAADNDYRNGQARDRVTGDVFVGTKSTNSETDEERDISNTISFRKFKDEYISSEAWDEDMRASGNGEWLKLVDYDNDGTADYVFLTEYTLDKAVASYTKSGETILEYNSMDIESIEDNDGIVDYVEDISVGDVVYYTKIDNRWTITKAPVVKATIQTVNFKDDSCTTTDGETYTESDIFNESRLDQLVANLQDKVEYNLYFDAYGWLRAYELANGNTYGLITELYKTTSKNEQFVKGVDLTVELKKGSAKIDEFDVENSENNVFLLSVLDQDAPHSAINNWRELRADLGYTGFTDDLKIELQPAIGQLGKEWSGESMLDTRIFRFTDKDGEPISYATTNVAVYTETSDGSVRLTSPVKLAKNAEGKQLYYVNGNLKGAKTTDTSELVGAITAADIAERTAYEVDYIGLDLTDGVKADAKHYPISGESRYINQSSYNNYVDAVHDTEYYVVDVASKKTIDYFTDFENVYEIPAEYITASYAVARNIESDYQQSDYWVADVIVIEVTNWKSTWDSTGVLYNNPSQTSGSVKRVETLNTESDDPDVQMELSGGRWDWNPRDNGNWAYRIDEKEFKDGILYADDLEPIVRDYNANGLYAGYVIRTRDISTNGGYIDVLFPGDAEVDGLAAQAEGEIGYKPVSSWHDGISVTNDQIFAILSNGGEVGVNTELRSLRVTNRAETNRLAEDHRIIWGVDKDGHVSFVIDVDFETSTKAAPLWLTRNVVAEVNGDDVITNAAGLWYTIAKEQIAAKGHYTFSEAFAAYQEWLASEKTEADNQKALAIISSAMVGATGDTLKDLNAMKNAILGNGGDEPGTEPTGSLVEAYDAYLQSAKDDAAKAALYKAAEGYDAEKASAAEKEAYAKIVAVADDALQDVTDGITGAKSSTNFEKLATAITAANKSVAAEKAIASADKVSAYDAAVTEFNGGLKANYTKAETLVKAYVKWNALKTGGSASAIATALSDMLDAYEAIGSTLNTTLYAYSDAKNTDNSGGDNSWRFDVGANYKTAYDAAGTEAAKTPVNASVTLEAKAAKVTDGTIIDLVVSKDPTTGYDLYTLTVDALTNATDLTALLDVKSGSVYDTTDTSNPYQGGTDKNLNTAADNKITIEFKGKGTPAGTSQHIIVKAVAVTAADKVKADAAELKELLTAAGAVKVTNAVPSQDNVEAAIKAAVELMVWDDSQSNAADKPQLTYDSKLKSGTGATVTWVNPDGGNWTVDSSIGAGSSWTEDFEVSVTLTSDGTADEQVVTETITVKITKS